MCLNESPENYAEWEKKKQDQKKHMVISFIENSKLWKTIL